MSLIPHRLVIRAAVLAAMVFAWSASAAPPAPVELVPHRAVYRMALMTARNSSKIVDVRGAMMFEQSDACDGWTTEQRFQLRFVYAEGEEMNMTTNYTTWEAKNGGRYRFNVRKLVNGETDEEVRGNALMKPSKGGGEVHYLMPDTTTVKLAPGTLFPTAHTHAVLERARKDERFLNRIVFDGADAEGASEINAVIGLPRPHAGRVDAPLLKGRTEWPVRMAFFPLSSTAETPEYETTVHLLDNGVVAGMQIDYGDFVVDAVLERLEALPKPRC
jgi:hypothetical protein